MFTEWLKLNHPEYQVDEGWKQWAAGGLAAISPFVSDIPAQSQAQQVTPVQKAPQSDAKLQVGKVNVQGKKISVTVSVNLAKIGLAGKFSGNSMSAAQKMAVTAAQTAATRHFNNKVNLHGLDVNRDSFQNGIVTFTITWQTNPVAFSTD